MATKRRFFVFEHLEARQLLAVLSTQIDSVAWTRTVDSRDSDTAASAIVAAHQGAQSPRFAAAPYHNFLWPSDVNDDQAVTVQDVRSGITHFLSGVSLLPVSTDRPIAFVDVNGDNRHTVADIRQTLTAVLQGETTGVDYVDLSEGASFTDEISAAVWQTTDYGCGPVDSGVGSTIQVEARYEGVLTAASVTADAVNEVFDLYGDSSEWIWAFERKTTSTIHVEGWGVLELSVLINAEGLEEWNSCSGSPSWELIDSEWAWSHFIVRMQGNFSIDISIVAGTDGFGTEGFAPSVYVDEFVNTTVREAIIDISAVADQSYMYGDMLADVTDMAVSASDLRQAFGWGNMIFETTRSAPFSATVLAEHVHSVVHVPGVSEWVAENYRRSGWEMETDQQETVMGDAALYAVYNDNSPDPIEWTFGGEPPFSESSFLKVRNNSDQAAIDSHDEIFAAREMIEEILTAVR